MNTTSDKAPQRDAVEALLEQATPRQLPPADVEREVRAAVTAEWQAAVQRKRTRRRTLQFGLAASLLVAAAVVFNLLNVGAPVTAPVASVDKLRGPVYRLGSDAELLSLETNAPLFAGQIITTQVDSGAGLRWSGDRSLRVDQNSRLEFVSAEEVFLHSGRVYFDSRPPDAASASSLPMLTVTTPHGTVSHLGTQFMTEVDGMTLRVSVREGEVRVAGRLFEESASRGQQLEVASGGRPVTTNISPHSAVWEWVEVTAPGIDVDGMSTWEFLQWVGRETGNRIEFASPEAERIAKRGRLKGTVNADPRTALRLRMLGEDLTYTVADGVITVTVSD